MSFDLFLERCAGSGDALVHRAAVLAVVRRYFSGPPDKHGFYDVEFPDGSRVELSAKELESIEEFHGVAFHLRNFTPWVMTFVFDVAKAGDLVIWNAQGEDEPDDPSAIVVSEAHLAAVGKRRAEHPVVCTSAEQLGELLGAGIESWSAFLDAIARGAGRSGSGSA